MTKSKLLLMKESRNGRNGLDELPRLLAVSRAAEWGLTLLGVVLIGFGAWLFLDELGQLWRQW